MNNKKILLLIEHLNGGGAERIICELSKLFEQEKDYEVVLAIFEDKGTSYEHCGQLINLNIPGTNNKIRKIVNLIKRIKAVKKIKKDKQISACISFMSNANMVNVFSKTSTTKTITSVRTVLSATTHSSLVRLIQKYVIRQSDKVITLSDGVKEDLVLSFNAERKKLETIYNSCRLVGTINKDNLIKNRSNDKFIIVNVGRLVKAKGQWHLIRAFSKLHREFPNTELRILGKGELQGELSNLIIKMGIQESVKMLGFVANPVVEYMKADLFVSSSLWEGLGNAIIEAMVCGLPVISTKCDGGPGEILSPKVVNPQYNDGYYLAEYGILTKAFNTNDYSISLNSALTEEEEALYSEMKEIIVNEELRKMLSQKSIERSEDFSSEMIFKQWKNCINEVCG